MYPAPTIHKITSDEQWHGLRAECVTASEVASLFGEGHKSYYQLWMEKAGRLAPDTEDNEMMKRGRWIEGAFPIAVREEFGMEIKKSSDFYEDADLRLGATPDFFTPDGTENWEAKSTTKQVFEEEWGFDLPLHYLLQHQAQYRVTGRTKGGILLMVMGGFGKLDMHRFPIDIHPPTIARIEQECAAFWDSIRREEEPELDYSRDASTLKAVYPAVSLREVDLSDDAALVGLCTTHQKQSADAKQAQALADATKTRILERVKDFNKVRCGDYSLTYAQISRKGYEVKPSTYSQLTIRSKKGN